MNPIRLSKISLLFMVGFYMFLVAFNNISDYNSNFAFVSNVMGMTDTFSETPPAYRTISSSTAHHIFYIMIILTELSIMLLCFKGVWELWKTRKETNKLFIQAKKFGIYALLLGLILWFSGFIAVGGEWFMMWQSETWNGNPTAFRNSILFMAVLIHLSNNND
ncbi:MAG: DUF2165 domain-containing protein [Bacteroidota bacterium]